MLTLSSPRAGPCELDCVAVQKSRNSVADTPAAPLSTFIMRKTESTSSACAPSNKAVSDSCLLFAHQWKGFSTLLRRRSEVRCTSRLTQVHAISQDWKVISLSFPGITRVAASSPKHWIRHTALGQYATRNTNSLDCNRVTQDSKSLSTLNDFGVTAPSAVC